MGMQGLKGADSSVLLPPSSFLLPASIPTCCLHQMVDRERKPKGWASVGGATDKLRRLEYR